MPSVHSAVQPASQVLNNKRSHCTEGGYCEGFLAASRRDEYAGAVNTAIAPYLIKCKLSLEVDEQPAIAEEVVEAGLGFHEGMHGRVQQLHKLPQRQQLIVHCPDTETH